MKRAACLIVALCLATLSGVSRACGQSSAAPEGGAARPIPTVRLKLQPAVEPVPALKYTLLPPYAEQTPGNAATLYYRAMLQYSAGWGRSKPLFDEEAQGWLSKPIGELPREKLRQWVAERSKPLEEVHAGARREQCDWELPIRGNRDLYDLPMDEIQEARSLQRVLSMQARLQMLDGRFDEAVRTLQTQFGLARHVNEVPLIIPSLVGTAIVGMAVEGLLEFAQQPGAPSLYWALTTLPIPMIDASRSFEAEGTVAYEMFPFLRDARRTDRSPDEWQSLLEEMTRRLEDYIRRDGVVPSNAPDGPADAARLTLAAAAIKGYAQAKRHLLERGMTRERVQQMPVGQAIAIQLADSYDEVRDEFLKWRNVRWLEAEQGLGQFQERLAERTEILPLNAALIPAYMQAILAVRRADRKIAELRVIEALRIYAARHDRKLPARLSDVTEVPIPIDPLLGKEFGYTLEGTTAILEVTVPPRSSNRWLGKRYEISIAEP